MRLAAAQIRCVPGDIGANLALHLAAIEAARGRGVDLLVFPELSLTDYESRPDLSRLARAADGPELARLAQAAHGVLVVCGFIQRNPAGLPFNSCALLGDARVLHVHRKLNLPTYGALVEGECYAAGGRLDLAPTRLGRLATLICADIWNPALPWLAALAGAELMAVPFASARDAVGAEFDNPANWTVNLRHTAMTYGLPVVAANHCDSRGGLDFWGGSAILDPSGRVLVQAGAEPDLIVADIGPADGPAARARLPTVRDAAPDFVRRFLERLRPASPPPQRKSPGQRPGLGIARNSE